jgi:Uma2 family endonuclease
MATHDPPPARVIWTYSDYRGLPDDGNRYEIIDGDLHVTPAPTTTHQTVSKRIQLALMLQVEEPGQGIVFNAPIDVIFSEMQAVQPDLLVVRSERRAIISERGIEGAPDLVVEILSPSTETRDRTQKSKLYASHGVAEYWLVDCSAHAVEVLALAPEGYVRHRRYGPGERVESEVFEVGIELDAVFA